MTRVLACYKWVLDEADVRIGEDGSVDFSRAKGKISEYDRNVIAEAGALAAQLEDGSPVGLTFGTESSKPSLKDALSRGLDEVFWAKGQVAEHADGNLTARCLAEAVRRIDDVEIVLCAEGSSDVFARQTASRMAAILDVPCVTSVTSVEVKGDSIVAKRRLDDSVETVEVQLPVILGILPEVIEAPIPGLKAIMAASKKPVTEFSAEELANGDKAQAKVSALTGSTVDRKCIRIQEDTPEATAQAFATALRKEGVL